ncbi:MAG: DNA polymerase III subunit [Clostridia bacterium]|nr:DNA polymerase III subunit [Clostridia bacterium]
MKQQFSRQQPVHAYLLTGARGLGKRTFAKVLASALFCTSENKPCGCCEACRRLMDSNEPDLLEVYPEDKSTISVDRVREIIQKVSQHAFGTGYRVVLIEPVEKMTPQAQNCLLKSLEEPISNVVFLLMTHELTATLGTIASRCIRVKFTPWPDDLLQSTLLRLGHASQAIQNVLPRCGGNIGTALDMLAESNLDNEAQQFAMDALSTLNDASAVSLSTKLKEDKGGADAYLSAIEQAIYQALLVRTGQLNSSFLSAYPSHWQKAASAAPVSEINALLSFVFETRRRKAGQVNWQSNIDHLMIRLLEEHTKWQQL